MDPRRRGAVRAWDNLLVSGRTRWLPAMGNSDSHAFDDRVGIPQTVVLVDDLSVEAVTAGLRAGRSWIAESADVARRQDGPATSGPSAAPGIDDVDADGLLGPMAAMTNPIWLGGAAQA